MTSCEGDSLWFYHCTHAEHKNSNNLHEPYFFIFWNIIHITLYAMCCEDFTKENSRKSQMKPLKHIYLGIYNWTPIILTEMIEKHYFVIDMTCNKFKRTRCKTKYKNGIQNKKPCKRKVITLWSYLIFFSLLPCLFSTDFEPTSSASKIFKTILVIILSCSPHLPTPKKNRIWMPGMAVQLQILPTLYKLLSLSLSLSLSNSNLQHNVFEQKPRNQELKSPFGVSLICQVIQGIKAMSRDSFCLKKDVYCSFTHLLIRQ